MRGLPGAFCLTEEITDAKITTITPNFSHTEKGSALPDDFQSLSYPLTTPNSRVKQLSQRHFTDNKNKALGRIAPAVKHKNTKRTAGNLAFTGAPTELLLLSESLALTAKEQI